MQNQKPKYGVKRFLAIADAYINPDTSTVEGIERALITWFCMKFDTTENDSRLLDMTLEDLLVFYNMHRIKDNPEILDELDPEIQDFDEWLKEEMGDDYVTEEKMIEEMIEYDKKEKDITDDLPDKITTDFSNLKD